MAVRVGSRAVTWRCDRPLRFGWRDRSELDDSTRSRLDRFPVRTIPRPVAAQRQVKEEGVVRWLQANLAVSLLILIVAVATLYILAH